jgi:hypothetical protein
MKQRSFLIWSSMPAVLLAVSAYATEPAAPAKDALKPDCAAMNGMDMSKMDMKDPAMQEMMQKCMDGKSGMSGMHAKSGMGGMRGMGGMGGEAGSTAGATHGDSPADASDAKTEHQHGE